MLYETRSERSFKEYHRKHSLTSEKLAEHEKVRVDEDMHGSLLKYCEEHNTKKAEFIREAINEKLERERQEKLVNKK